MERNNTVGIGSAKAGIPGELARGGKAINGLRLVHVSRNIQHTQLREATTGRPVMVPGCKVPKIWAVADPTPAAVPETQSAAIQPAPAPKVELAFYRKYTEAMLRRYLRISVEVGRVPSVMDRELFRGKASHYKISSFEDGIIFCVDVERCLAKLRKEDQRVIQRIAIQGYTHQEAAPRLGLSLRWCFLNYCGAIDKLTEIFLAGRLLEPQKCCQEAEGVEIPTSNSESAT